jgi:hypothetical protein
MSDRFLRNPWAWLVWVSFSVYLTLPGLRWHLDAFSTYGPRFIRIYPLLVIALVAGLCGYLYLRTKGWWRYEPAFLAGIFIVGIASYQPRALLIGVWIISAAFAAGRWSLRKTGFALQGIAEEIALSCAAGLSELILALFVLGLLRLYYPVTFLLLLGLPCILLLSELRHLFTLLRQAGQRWASEERSDPLTGLLVFFSVVFIAFQLIVVLTPSVVFDALAYHLADARFFAEGHTLARLPFQDQSLLPQGFEVLMTIGYALDSQAAAQLMPPIFFALSLAAGFALARRCGIAVRGAFAGVALASMVPFLHWEGSELKNDFALAFFLLCAVIACLRWLEQREFRWILLSAFFLASAFGIKHVALFGAIPLGLIYLAAIWRQSHRWRCFALLALVFLIAGTYWQAHTFLLTGNPVFPFNAGTAVTIQGAEPAPFGQRFVHWLSIPWRAQFERAGTFESQSPSPLGVVFVFLLPVWLATRSTASRRLENLCLFFAALYLFYWSFQWGILRFAIAPIVIIILLMSGRLVRIFDASGIWTRAVLLGSLCYCAIVSVTVITYMEINAVQLKLLAHQIDWVDYLRIWPSVYRPIEYLRQASQPGDLILSIDDCAVAYAPDPARFHGYCTNDHVYSHDLVRSELERMHYRFLLLPQKLNYDPGVPASYRDDFYVIYRLAQ